MADALVEKKKTEAIKAAYEKKIASYHQKLVVLETKRRKLIADITNPTYHNLNEFMRGAESVGIDEMNHRTIIEMLGKQYLDWFGEKSEATTVYEQERLSNKYLDTEML